MPMGTAIIIAGIVAAFVIYAATLAWADFYSRNYRQPH
jgi:H+/gluconate symporter-like permease